MTEVLFASAHGRNFVNSNYGHAFNVMEKRGYQVVPVTIDWNGTTPKDWVRQFHKVYSQYDRSKTILAGHSFGAIAAFLLAGTRNPLALWTFSLSPFFRDDKLTPAQIEYVGPTLLEALQDLPFAQVAEQLHCPTLLFAGELESNTVERSIQAAKIIPNAELIVMSRTKHNDILVPGSTYLREIEQHI